MTVYQFTIPGKPGGWRQQRAYGRKTPSRLADGAKSWRGVAVAMICHEWRRPALPDGPFALEVEAVYARPKRLTCGHTRKPCSCPPGVLLGEPEWHTSKPDLRNIAKLAEDALVQAGVISDDRWVCQTADMKRYAGRGESPHTAITLWQLTSRPVSDCNTARGV